MSLISHIENLRNKPEQVRRMAAFWYSFGITAVIFAIWLTSFTSLGTSTKATISDAVNRAGTPADSMVASVGEFFGDVKDIFFGPKKIKYAPVEAIPGSR